MDEIGEIFCKPTLVQGNEVYMMIKYLSIYYSKNYTSLEWADFHA